ncbi:MAG: LytR family transcriptional regulator [Microbacterium sp.]|nr:MAG: LytR family transcriptional regulator [Microbacterium sp.]
MPNHPPDRFDELPTPDDARRLGESRRVGAHRAEEPRLRRRSVLLWAALATVVLIAGGIVATLWAGGRFGPGITTPVGPTAVVTADPVLDTTYTVVVLNATPQDGLGGQLSADIVAAGWSADDVTAGDAGSHDFARTTVFYAHTDDEAAARGLAQAIGGADVELSEAYQDPENEELRQLVVVIGLDRATEATPTG